MDPAQAEAEIRHLSEGAALINRIADFGHQRRPVASGHFFGSNSGDAQLFAHRS